MKKKKIIKKNFEFTTRDIIIPEIMTLTDYTVNINSGISFDDKIIKTNKSTGIHQLIDKELVAKFSFHELVEKYCDMKKNMNSIFLIVDENDDEFRIMIAHPHTLYKESVLRAEEFTITKGEMYKLTAKEDDYSEMYKKINYYIQLYKTEGADLVNIMTNHQTEYFNESNYHVLSEDEITLLFSNLSPIETNLSRGIHIAKKSISILVVLITLSGIANYVSEDYSKEQKNELKNLKTSYKRATQANTKYKSDFYNEVKKLIKRAKRICA